MIERQESLVEEFERVFDGKGALEARLEQLSDPVANLVRAAVDVDDMILSSVAEVPEVQEHYRGVGNAALRANEELSALLPEFLERGLGEQVRHTRTKIETDLIKANYVIDHAKGDGAAPADRAIFRKLATT